MSTTSSRPSVSIVIPIYNVEEWLRACLGSLQDQTFTDWEAILVDDGSSDASEDIAREFAATDPRFRVLAGRHEGAGAARNLGLDNAVGTFLTFVDSDDILPPRALEMLSAAMSTGDADVVCGLGMDVFVDGQRTRYWTYESARQFDETTRTYELGERPSLLDDHTPWGKLIRRSLFERTGIRFPPRAHSQDIVPVARVLLAANRITVAPLEVYDHRRRERAISSELSRPKTISDWLGQMATAVDVVQAHGDPTVTVHYASRHVPRQWWSRAFRFAAYPPEVVDRLESLARRIADVAADSIDLTAPLVGRTLLFFAGGGASRAWSDLEVSPFQASVDGDAAPVARAAIVAARALDPDDALEGPLSAELLLGRVLGLVARSYVDGEAGEALLADARPLLERIDESVWSQVALPPLNRVAAAHPAADEAIRIIDGLPVMGAQLTSATWGERGLTLRGVMPSIDLDGATIRFVPTGGGSARVGTNVDVRTGQRHWQAVVGPRSASHSGSLLVHRPYAPDIRLPVRAAAGGDDAEVRRRIFTYPGWRSNPYLAMLQSAVRADGHPLAATADFDELIEELTDDARVGVVHLHWPSPITDEAHDEQHADERVDRFLAALGSARSRDRAVVWSVHNVLPHDSAFPVAARRLHQGIADAADVIHALNPATYAEIGDAYRVDEHKIQVIGHSSYLGAYGGRIEPERARRELGIDPGATNALFFGQLRVYKGLDRLFAAARIAGQATPLNLLLAGNAAGAELDDDLAALEAAHVKVTAAIRFVEDREVPLWFSAADVAVLPYRRVLNSGTTFLAATFGVPVILPADSALVGQFEGQPWVRFFDLDSSEESIAALLTDPWFRDPAVRESALSYARANPPHRMASAYQRLIESL